MCPACSCEVTSSSPWICMNCRSSGVAMLFATVSGLAPGIARLHLDDRIVHRRQVVHRQLQVASTPNRITETVSTAVMTGSADERFGEVHDRPPAARLSARPPGRGSTMRTLPPGVTPIWPSTTTRSPAARPFLDDDQISLPLAQLYRAQLGGGVVLHDVDERALGRQSAARSRERAPPPEACSGSGGS